MADFGQVLNNLTRLQSKWLGYKFLVASTKDKSAISALGVSEVDIPRATIVYKSVPTLSSIKREVPVGEIYGDLILRAPVVRDQSLWDRFSAMTDVLKGKEDYETAIETLLIAQIETSTLLDILPIRVWVCEGCQAKDFKPANANVNGTGNMPLDELILRVGRIHTL